MALILYQPSRVRHRLSESLKYLNIRPEATCLHYTCQTRFLNVLNNDNNSNAQPSEPIRTKHTWIFIDSVFPVRFARWDPRAYLISFQQDDFMSRIERIFTTAPSDDINLLDLVPRPKDGGIFALFSSIEGTGSSTDRHILDILRTKVEMHGGLPSWFGNLKGVRLWEVKGKPWMEDMNRFASSTLKVEFEGADVHVETLWERFRPYGRILDITSPSPVPTGSTRFSTVSFSKLHSAVVARNCVHGDVVVGIDGKMTRLATTFEQPLKAHYIRDWLSSHPRIVIPVVVFLLGTMTYAIFDPIRVLAVQSKIQRWLEWKDYSLIQWLQRNTVDRFASSPPSNSALAQGPGMWKERQDSEKALESYLHDLPETAAFVHGPQGSGKTTTVRNIVDQANRHVLLIDCNELYKSGTDSGTIASLASQTGYWPLFTFLKSINNILDLASVGIIGKPAGLNTSTETQVNEMLEVIGKALENVQASSLASAERKERQKWQLIQENQRKAALRLRIKRGDWHDGRLDCVAGNGVMSELGIGDEPTYGHSDNPEGDFIPASNQDEQHASRVRIMNVNQKFPDVGALPVVIIKNFASGTGPSREIFLDLLAAWATSLVKNKVAHVFVLSDNRENSRRLTRALASVPLVYVPFSDADRDSALSFVVSKLADVHVKLNLTSQEAALIARLGGRASDLETLVHKVRNGESVTFAIQDVINRGVSELRKLAFGDDVEDSKNLPWSREQAWTVIKQLAKSEKIPYYHTLTNFPFKGNETALRAMEQAELVTITLHHGRPAAIKPGRPIYKWVFQKLVEDSVFNSLQELGLNEQQLISTERVIHTCEQELLTLKEMNQFPTSWNPFATSPLRRRISYLLSQMDAAEKRRVFLERDIKRLRQSLRSQRE